EQIFQQRKGRPEEGGLSAHGELARAQTPRRTTFSAAGPLGPSTMSNSTFSPSVSVLKPSWVIAEKWTNRSLPPSCSMKPKPLASLNHFTLPVARDISYSCISGGVLRRCGSVRTYDVRGSRPYGRVSAPPAGRGSVAAAFPPRTRAKPGRETAGRITPAELCGR